MLYSDQICSLKIISNFSSLAGTMCLTSWLFWTLYFDPNPVPKERARSLQSGATLTNSQGHGSGTTQRQAQLSSVAALSWGPAKRTLILPETAEGGQDPGGTNFKAAKGFLIFDQQESQSRNVGCLNDFFFFKLRKGHDKYKRTKATLRNWLLKFPPTHSMPSK